MPLSGAKVLGGISFIAGKLPKDNPFVGKYPDMAKEWDNGYREAEKAWVASVIKACTMCN